MKWVLNLVCAASAAILVACGGGSNSICGDQVQGFSIDFTNYTYLLSKGTPSTISTVITPESCRSSMHFSSSTSVLNNPPPPGMSISNGNLTGTPTTAGSYTYRIGIDSVDGYQSLSSKPYSRMITITVN